MEILHLEALVAAVLFIGLRVGGLMLFAPFLSSQSIPAQMKVALAVALTALLYPACRPTPTASGVLDYAGFALAEMVTGLLLGLASQLTVEAAQLAGQMVGVQSGYSLVTLFDPQTQADTAVMATFNQFVVLLIFVQLNADHWLLRGLAASFSYLPPGSLITGAKAGYALLRAAGGIWLAALQLAAPVVVATMLVDVTLGFLAKASPQLPVLFLGLPIKNLLGLTVLTGSLVLWPRFFEHRFSAGIALGEQLLHLAK